MGSHHKYFDRYYTMYMNCTEAERAESRAHWIKVHRENLKKGYDNCIAFSAQIIAQIVLAEDDLSKKVDCKPENC